MESCLGEIANRFSRDLAMVDWVVIYMSYTFVIVSILHQFCAYFGKIMLSFSKGIASIISYLVVICMANAYITIGVVPGLILILIIRHYYLKSSRQVQRMEAESE